MVRHAPVRMECFSQVLWPAPRENALYFGLTGFEALRLRRIILLPGSWQAGISFVSQSLSSPPALSKRFSIRSFVCSGIYHKAVLPPVVHTELLLPRYQKAIILIKNLP